MNKVITSTSISDKNTFIIIKGLAMSIIITLISIFLFALIITYTEFPESAIASVIIGISALSILVRNINYYNKTK